MAKMAKMATMATMASMTSRMHDATRTEAAGRSTWTSVDLARRPSRPRCIAARPALLAATLLWLAAPGCTARTGLTTGGSGAADDAADADAADSSESSADAGNSSSASGSGDTADSSDSTDAADDSTEDGAGFLDIEDTMPEPLDMCDSWAQDCPEGQKCTPAATTPGSGAFDASICVDAGTEPPGAPCTIVEDADPYGATDTCDATGKCYNFNPDTGVGTCIEMCAGTYEDPTCPITGWECDIAATGTLDVCIPRCAPIPGVCPDCWDCPGDQACIAAWEGDTLGGFICFPLSAEGAAGESCECANCCATGLMCTDAATYGPTRARRLCCTEFCDITNLALMCAGPDQQCVALFEPTDPHFANVGACMVP